jgi:hypothetical protein
MVASGDATASAPVGTQTDGDQSKHLKADSNKKSHEKSQAPAKFRSRDIWLVCGDRDFADQSLFDAAMRTWSRWTGCR